MIRFSRLGLFLTGIVVMLLLFYLQRYVVYNNSNFTYGVLKCDSEIAEKEYEAEMDLYYYVGMQVYHQTVRETTELANQTITVRYPKKNIDKGKIYIPTRFWGISVLWILFPIMLWTAFVFTLLNEEMKLEVDWRNQL